MGFFDNAWKALDGFGQEAGKHVGPALGETWKHLDAFGQEVGKNAGPVVGEALKHLDAVGKEAGVHIGGAAHQTATWIKKHPGEAAGIVACVVAAPVGVGLAAGVLHIFGFTATGVAAGSAAAAAQAGIGNVAAGSTFAILQSAGAGGAGAVLVDCLAAGTATAAAIAATAPGLIKAIKEGKKEVVIDHVTYKIEDMGVEELEAADKGVEGLAADKD